MGIEIERKFLVASDGWRPLVRRSEKLQQGYLASGGAVTVRVRLVDDRQGFLTIKSGGTTLARSEFEYEVPARDARELLQLSSTGLAKVRHTLDLPGGEWVVDEFGGPHQGLLLAEVELESPDAAPALPDWLGAEVTGDPQYYNSRLAAVADGDR